MTTKLVKRAALGLFKRFAWGPLDLSWRDGRGLSGYESSVGLYAGEARVATVAWGGSSTGSTVYLSLTGEGCGRLKPDAFSGLRRLAEKHGGKLTRADIAVDWFGGEHGVEEVREAWASQDGAFVGLKGGRRPKHRLVGPWDDMTDASGRSFYVGTRGAGKMLRAYEKGRQGGDAESKWVRYEVELRSEHRDLPLAMLEPTSWLSYWAGAYPFLAAMATNVEPLAVPTKPSARLETLEAAARRSVQACRRQFGAMVSALTSVLPPKDVLGLLVNDRTWKPLRKCSDLVAQGGGETSLRKPTWAQQGTAAVTSTAVDGGPARGSGGGRRSASSGVRWIDGLHQLGLALAIPESASAPCSAFA